MHIQGGAAFIMLHGPILAALTATHLYFDDKFLNLNIDKFALLWGEAQ